MKSLACATFAILLSTALSQGQIIYAEGFDSEASSKVAQQAMADTVVRYLDYSSFSVEGEPFAVPEAPNKVADSAPTQGVFLQANLVSQVPNAINLTAADARDGTPVVFSGTYKLTFDVFISVAEEIPGGGTEQFVWSVGSDAQDILGLRESSTTQGIWGWLTGEGGNGAGSGDSAVFNAMEPDLKDNITQADLWLEAFDDQRVIPGIPANAWTRTSIEVFSDKVRVLYNDVLFHEIAIEATEAEGVAMVGYADPWGSVSENQNFQWGLIDNFVVEAFTEPALEVVGSVPFETVAEVDASSTSTFTLANRRDVPLTVTSSALSGADADSFAVTTVLPLVVPARENADLMVAFKPGTLGGLRKADLKLMTDDPDTPTITLPLEASRLGLLVHYKLDETDGEVMADSSGNSIDGRYRSAAGGAITLGAEGLASGTGIMVDPQGDAGLAVAEIPATPVIPNLSTYTVSMWFKLDPRDNDTGSVLFGRGTNLDQSGALVLLANSNKQPLQWIVDSSGGVTTTGELVQSDTTYHLVFSHLDTDPDAVGADRIRIYLNGDLAEEIDIIDEVFTYTPEAVFQFGGFHGTSGLTGLLDDLQVYSKELSAEDVAFLFDNPGRAIGASDDGGMGPDIDTDEDGLTDAQEAELGTDPTLADTDGDGFSDGQEVAAMTDPTSAASQLRILEVAASGDGDVQRTVTWESKPGVAYVLEVSENLTDWSVLAGEIAASDGTTTSHQQANPPAGQAYYRVGVK